MGAPSVPNTFSAGNPAYASTVNANFTAIVNGLTAGSTWDVVVATITTTGAATFGGAITCSSTIDVGGGVASDIDPSAANTYKLGDSTQTWQALYLDNDATDGGAIYFDAGSTEFIKANAAGTTLNLAGFTTYDFDAAVQVDGDVTIGDGTGANVTTTLNADSGDAKLTLQVNNASANAWDIFNDNSDSDKLKLAYNGTTGLAMTTAGYVSATAGLEAPYFLPNADDSSAPGANRLYKANVPKAWANITGIAGDGASTLNDDHNISSVSEAGQIMTVNIDTNMGNTTYVPSVSCNTVTTHPYVTISSGSLAAGSFNVYLKEADTGAYEDWSALYRLYCIIMGDQ